MGNVNGKAGNDFSSYSFTLADESKSQLPEQIKRTLFETMQTGFSDGDLRLSGCGMKDHMIPELYQKISKFGRTLRVLDLSNNSITSKGASLLFDRLIESESTITSLSLSSNQIGDECMLNLGKYLQNNQHLEMLEIGSNKISDKGIELLSNYLIGNNKLKYFDLSENKGLTNKSVSCLVKLIGSSRIEDIHVNETSIDYKNSFICALAQNMIINGSKTLKLKRMEANDDDIIRVAELIKIHGNKNMKEICILREQKILVSLLDLSSNQMDDECLKQIGEYLLNVRCLKVLNISGNQITDRGIDLFSNYIIGNTSLKELYLSSNKRVTDKSMPVLLKITESSNIVHIGVNNTLINQKNSLATMLAQNAIKCGSNSLKLSNMQITDEDMNKICDFMKKDGIDKLKQINLDGNKLTSKGINILLDTLRECNSAISELNLSDNNLDIDNIKQLGLYLEEDQHLEQLALSNNNIQDEGIHILSGYLIGNMKLKELNLSVNKDITNISVEYLLQIAKKSWISNIYIGATGISPNKKQEINHAFKIPIEKRDILLTSKKPKRDQTLYASLAEYGNQFIKGDVDLLIKNRFVPTTEGLLKMKDNLITDVDVFELLLKIEKLEEKFNGFESNSNILKFDEFQQKIDDIMKKCEIVESLEKEMMKNHESMSQTELKENALKRDRIRNKLIQNFESLSVSMKKSGDTISAIFNEEEWIIFEKLNDDISKQKLNFESKREYSILPQLKSSLIHGPHQSVKESQLSGDFRSDVDEIYQNIMNMMNGMNSYANNMFRAMLLLNQLIVDNIMIMEKRFNALKSKKQRLEAEKKRFEFEINQQAMMIECQRIKLNKKVVIEQLKCDIERIDEEIRDLSIEKKEKDLELERGKRILTQLERENLELQKDEIENKINHLEDEYEELIDKFKHECNDENGHLIFPDFEIPTPLESPNGSSPFLSSFLSFQSNLIRIPQTLKTKSNRCEILERIGDGGFSSVFKMKMKKRGKDSDDDIFAFKQFTISVTMIREDEIKMIEREIEILAHLKHDNIVKIIGAIGNPDAKDKNNRKMGVGIVMECCANGSLRSLLNKNANNRQQLLNMDLIIYVLLGAAQGLEYLHNHIPYGIIHGDIKSDNILIDKEYNAKLCDFGISKLQQTTMASSSRNGGGTLAYKAPEVFEKDPKINVMSDVYSFGCVILEMLTGERPWSGLYDAQITKKVAVDKEEHDFGKVRKDARQKLVSVMKRCLDYNKDKRPSMNEVRMELEMMMNNAVLIGLDDKSEEYNKIENLFFPGGDKEGSLNRKKYRIVKIEKVSNRFAEKMYMGERERIKSMIFQSDASSSASSSSIDVVVDINERLLFHGTSQVNPMMILNHPDAFMKDYSSPGFYGRGLYFAELARYSNGSRKDEYDNRIYYRYNIAYTNRYQMLVCSVICGKSYEVEDVVTEMTREISQKNLGTEFHSIHAGPHRPGDEGPGEDDSCMYVVYKDTQVVARYLITYEDL